MMGGKRASRIKGEGGFGPFTLRGWHKGEIDRCDTKLGMDHYQKSFSIVMGAFINKLYIAYTFVNIEYAIL